MSFSQCTQRLTFVGSGNMASAIIAGLADRGYPGEQIQVCGPSETQLADLQARYQVLTAPSAETFLAQTDVLLLCVKPQVMQSVCEALSESVKGKNLTVVSIAAGTSGQQIHGWLGQDLPLVRVMPNTPAMVHEGASGLYAGSSVEADAKNFIEQLFSAVGSVCWVDDESALHAVTALSGSGPAYGFLMLEAMEQAASSMGLPSKVAHTLACQTLLGAARLAAESEHPPAELKRRVMSPGGTTEQAIFSMEDAKFPEIVHTAILKAWQRSYTLAGENPPAERESLPENPA